MNTEDVPFEVAEFISANISSLGQLELVLLLHSKPSPDWTAERAAAELRSNASVVERHFETLCAKGVLDRDPGPPTVHRISSSEHMEKRVASLSKIYSTHRTRVIDLIYSERLDKIRVFADAFKIRKG